MASVHCGACGTSLRETAKFCPACGSAQASLAGQGPAPAQYPPPLTDRPGPAAHAAPAALPLSAVDVVAAVLAILGGATMCFIALYAVFYLPLHHEYPVNYGESPRVGDILAVVSGLVAIAIGVLLLTRRPGNATARGIWLVVAGTPTLIVALLWAFPVTFHLSLFPVPFYFAYLYFTDLGVVHIGSGYVPLPLVIACAMPIAAGLVVVMSSATRVGPPAGPR